MTTNELVRPFVARSAVEAGQCMPNGRDAGETVDDPLPHVVQRQPDGAIKSRDTYVTEVHQETTDDN